MDKDLQLDFRAISVSVLRKRNHILVKGNLSLVGFTFIFFCVCAF